TDDEYLLVGVLFHQRAYRSGLGVGGGTKTVTVLGFGGGVGQPLGLRQVHADLHAVGRGDPPLVLHVLPGSVVALGTDEGEHIALPAVLTHQGRRQPQPSACLKIGRHAKDRGGQQVNLVVDDESPIAGIEQFEVGVGALSTGRHHLVGGDGDRANLLAGARVLSHRVLGE